MEKVSETEVDILVQPPTETTRVSLDQINEEIRYHEQLLINEKEEYDRKVLYHTTEKAKKEEQRDQIIALGVKTYAEVEEALVLPDIMTPGDPIVEPIPVSL